MDKVAASKSALFQQYEKELSNPVAMVLKAAEGLPASMFDALMPVTGLNKCQLAAFVDTAPRPWTTTVCGGIRWGA